MDDKEASEKELRLDLETFRSNIESTADLIENGFLETDTRFGLGELTGHPSMDMLLPQVSDVDAWVVANKKEREDFLRNVTIELGLVPELLTSERAKKTYTEEGVKGQSSEGGGEVMVFSTKFSRLELHVLIYGNDDVGRRYDLVVAE